MTIAFDDKRIERHASPPETYFYRLVFDDGRDVRQREGGLEIASLHQMAEQVVDGRNWKEKIRDRLKRRASPSAKFEEEAKALCSEREIEEEGAGTFKISGKELLDAEEMMASFTQALDSLTRRYGIKQHYIIEPIDYPG